jgi:hypothetical protein
MITDAFTVAPPANPLIQPVPLGHSISLVYVDVRGGGPDRVVVPPGPSLESYFVDSDGNSRFRFGGPSSFGIATAAGDRVRFLAGASGYASVTEPNVTVHSVDGGAESIFCTAGTNPKLRVDPLDSVGPDCGDDVLPPRLPTG